MAAFPLLRFFFAAFIAWSLVGCGTVELQGDAFLKVDRALLARRPASLATWKGADSTRWDILRATEARTALLTDGWDRVALKEVPESAKGRYYMIKLAGSLERGISSAVPITSDGYYLTAAHCVDGSSLILISLNAQLRLVKAPARVVWTSKEKHGVDLAVIHAPIRPWGPFPLADPEDLRKGNAVAIAGWSRVGLERSVSSTAAGRIVSISPLRVKAPDFVGHVIAHDVPVNQGDSGGPLVTANGRLAGINASVRVSFTGLVRVMAGWDGSVERPLSGYTAIAHSPGRDWLRQIIAADRNSRPK